MWVDEGLTTQYQLLESKITEQARGMHFYVEISGEH
jgi:hypothetical protein